VLGLSAFRVAGAEYDVTRRHASVGSTLIGTAPLTRASSGAAR